MKPARPWKELRDALYATMTPERQATHEQRCRDELDRLDRGVIAYPVTLTPDSHDAILVTFPDVPEAVAFGRTEEEAVAHAIDALFTAFDAYVTDGKKLPLPSWIEGARVVEIPLAILPNPREED